MAELPASVPRWNSHLGWLGDGVLRLAGWRMDIRFPDTPRFVIILAPHTSNWDFVYGLAAILSLRVRVHFWAKHSLFRWPFGGLLRWAGGVAVERSSARGRVAETAARMRAEHSFILGLAPEGTRQRVEQWKTGFYQVALKANVPIVPAYLDYRHKLVATGPVIHPTGDYAADLKKLRTFYRTITPKRPEHYSRDDES